MSAAVRSSATAALWASAGTAASSPARPRGDKPEQNAAPEHGAVDDLALGRVLRFLRIRLGWTQRLAAVKAGVSTTSYGEIERGRIDRVPIGKLRKIASIYDVRLVLEPRWRGAAL